jgi:hypothetical protein
LKQPAELRRQLEAAESLRLCEKNLALWDERYPRVRARLVQQLEDAKKRAAEAGLNDAAA